MTATARKAIFGGANSVDNYIARDDDAVDWILWSDEAKSLMTDFWKAMDTVVMGRKTYEVSLGQRSGGAGSPGVKTYVASRTLQPDPARDRDVEIVADAVGLLADLKRRPGKNIFVMGGGELGRSLLDAGLIDELHLNIHPMLLGAGIPLFHRLQKQIDLELLECTPFKNGCISARYRVRH